MKLDIDENPVHASRYDVLSIPTVILFAEGEAKQIVVGAAARGALPRVVLCDSGTRGTVSAAG